MMEPKDYFNKSIIGKLITRKINKLFLKESDHSQPQERSVSEEKSYDVIDIVKPSYDNPNIDGFIINEWCNEQTKEVLFIHKNFVKKFRRN